MGIPCGCLDHLVVQLPLGHLVFGEEVRSDSVVAAVSKEGSTKMPLLNRECDSCWRCRSAKEALLAAHQGCLTHIFYDVTTEEDVEKLLVRSRFVGVSFDHGRDHMWQVMIVHARYHSKHPLFIQAVEHFCNECSDSKYRTPSLHLLSRSVLDQPRCEEVVEHFIRDDNVFFLRWWHDTFRLNKTFNYYFLFAFGSFAYGRKLAACMLYCAENLNCWSKELLESYPTKEHLPLLEGVLQRMLQSGVAPTLDLGAYGNEDIVALLDKYNVQPWWKPDAVIQALKRNKLTFVELMLARGGPYVLDEVLARTLEHTLRDKFAPSRKHLNKIGQYDDVLKNISSNKMYKELEALPNVMNLVVNVGHKMFFRATKKTKKPTISQELWQRDLYKFISAIEQHKTAEAFMDTSFAKRLPHDLVKYVLKFL